MQLTVKALQLNDFPELFRIAGIDPHEPSSLATYERRLREGLLSGHDDAIVVVLRDGVIVGFIHWYIDTYENNEVVPVGTYVDAVLSEAEQAVVRNFLETRKEIMLNEGL
jgi:hypothetical protein